MQDKRKMISIRLKPVTITKLKVLAKESNTSQGRIIDNLVKEKKCSNESKTS
jgi:hypothetical protein